MDVKDGHGAGDHAREQERAPAQSLAHCQPQQHKHDERKAETEQRRALRHQVGEHWVQPLVVEVAVQRVLAW